MAFEYSTQGATLDFPNPYRLENQFLIARGLALLAGGVALLVLARGTGAAVTVDRADIAQGGLVLLIIAAAVLALAGIVELGRAARQLRVFFGRGQPASLAPDLPREAQGTSPRAQALVEQLRQGAIALAVPEGALNGVLYSLSRHLVTAPRELRDYQQVRFANLLAAAGLLLLFAVTWLITPNPVAQALAAAVYLLLGSALILRSYLSGTESVVALKPLGLVVLMVFGIVGTVLVGRAAVAWPQLAWLEGLALPTIALVMLVASVSIEGLGLLAGFAHVDEPPPASTASEQVAVSFNADPNLLLQEVDRELQKRWNQGIPNRRYIWQPPVVEPTLQAGNFVGVAFEESQPLPPQAVRRMDWSTCLAFPRFYWLAVIDALGLVLTLVGCVFCLRLGAEVAAGTASNWSLGSIGFILIVVGGYGLRVAHRLWGRLDFESTLTWLDFNGSYARAQVGLGSPLTDRVRSERNVVNVESMTLRAWVVQARSVIFSYRDHEVGSRSLVGMTGDMDAARAWTHQVRSFAQTQSVVVVPQGGEDARRLQQLQGANQLAGGSAGGSAAGSVAALVSGWASPSVAASTTQVTTAAAPRPGAAQCAVCAAELAAGARFCAQCGTGAPALG
jgi:hypothetical protein